MRIVACQFYSHNVLYGDYASEINKRYCDLNGYTYYVEKDTNKILNKIEGRSWTWYKPHLIKDVLEKYPDCDYVLFLDIDAVFSTDNRKIEEFIDDSFDIRMTQDHGPSLVNAGVMLLKNSEWSKTFVNGWWDICEEFPRFKTGLWHDQTCIQLLYERIDKTRFSIIDNYDFNAREYNENMFIFHAFSYGQLPYRTIDLVYNRKFNVKLPTESPLSEVAKLFRTDKSYLHDYYNRFYNKLFSKYKSSCDILEIGILDGQSLKVWNEYFENGVVHGMDIKDLSLNESRIRTFLVDQSDENQLFSFSNLGNKYDVIIDDGSHKMRDQQITIQILFDNLKSGGYFVIEDLQTSLECRMPHKSVFGWGDPNKTTCLDMLYSIQKGEPRSDFKTSQWDHFISQVDEVMISEDKEDSIYSIIKKK